jgi:hypothetical protein
MREQRRSRRILASIPLEIEWDGEPQPALTGAINLNGALILSPVNLPVGSDLRIKNPDTVLQTRGRVVWCGNLDSTGWYKLGVEFRDSSLEFWGDRHDAQGEEAPLFHFFFRTFPLPIPLRLFAAYATAELYQSNDKIIFASPCVLLFHLIEISCMLSLTGGGSQMLGCR